MFYSPLVAKLLENVPCCSDAVVCLPECSVSSLKHLSNIFSKGFTDFTAIEEIKDVSKVLGIDLSNFDYAEQSVVHSAIVQVTRLDDVQSKEKVTKAESFVTHDDMVIKSEPLELIVKVKEEPCDDLIKETLEELSGYFAKNIYSGPDSNLAETRSLNEETNIPAKTRETPTKSTKRPVACETEDFAKKIRRTRKQKVEAIEKEEEHTSREKCLYLIRKSWRA